MPHVHLSAAAAPLVEVTVPFDLLLNLILTLIEGIVTNLLSNEAARMLSGWLGRLK